MVKMFVPLIAMDLWIRLREWSQWPGLNRRPTVYETVALPLSYIGVSTADIVCIAGFTVNPNGKHA
jgi:hypothetical protein